MSILQKARAKKHTLHLKLKAMGFDCLPPGGVLSTILSLFPKKALPFGQIGCAIAVENFIGLAE